MNIIKYPSAEAVDKAMRQDEPMLAAISFDGKTAIIGQVDEAVEHHVLLAKAGFPGTDIDRYFRIVFDESGADWTFVCPPDYKEVPYKDRRIEAFSRTALRSFRISCTASAMLSASISRNATAGILMNNTTIS